MKAAILEILNSPLIIDEVELPTELLPGQVAVEVHYSGICGSQIGEIQGRKGPDAHLPHLLGHEGAGRVTAIGPGVTTVAPGDRVVMHWRPGSGIQAPCPTYRWQGRELNAGWVTTFNEAAVVSENRLTVLPDDFPMDLAPLLGCAVTTGLGVISNDARLKMGESLVIFGAGGVGLNMVQGGALASAWPVIAVDRFENRLELARSLGATHVINSRTEPDVIDRIRDILDGAGADVVIDNTGNPQIMAQAYELTDSRGRTILVGVPPVGEKLAIHSLPLHFGRLLTGSHGGESQPEFDIPRYIRLYRQGLLNLSGLITRRYPLEDINLALEHMANGQLAGRCLIEMPAARGE